MTRVLLLGDPSKDLGALAEPECRRHHRGSGSGRSRRAFPWNGSRFPPAPRSRWTAEWRTWIGSPASCAGLIEFTQAGGEVNLVVNGINVGAQPYWNAEATMLMHTRGILVMTPKAAMVLTGKRALDYSGSISAEDNQGIGGYDRIMGVNGQAQYWAADIDEACHILLPPLRSHLRAPGRTLPAAGRDDRSHRPRCADLSSPAKMAKRDSRWSARSCRTRPIPAARSPSIFAK